MVTTVITTTVYYSSIKANFVVFLPPPCFDHINDHRRIWSMWRQWARKVGRACFSEQKRLKSAINKQKNPNFAVGVVEAAGSSPVTQTKKSEWANAHSDFFARNERNGSSVRDRASCRRSESIERHTATMRLGRTAPVQVQSRRPLAVIQKTA